MDVTKEVLIGALLWLRNHYDLGDPKLKERVLLRVDKVLEDANTEIAHSAAFREAYPIKGPLPKSWRVCPECRSRVTKIFNLNTGLYTCQICGYEYEAPKRL